MRKAVGEARRAALRLFLAYTLASLLPLLALAGALVQDLRREAVRSGLEQGRAQSAVVEEMAIAPAPFPPDPTGSSSDYTSGRVPPRPTI